MAFVALRMMLVRLRPTEWQLNERDGKFVVVDRLGGLVAPVPSREGGLDLIDRVNNGRFDGVDEEQVLAMVGGLVRLTEGPHRDREDFSWEVMPDVAGVSTIIASDGLILIAHNINSFIACWIWGLAHDIYSEMVTDLTPS
jgi:hypothetical protein